MTESRRRHASHPRFLQPSLPIRFEQLENAGGIRRCGVALRAIHFACGEVVELPFLLSGSSNDWRLAAERNERSSCRKGVARPERFELPTFWFVARSGICRKLLLLDYP